MRHLIVIIVATLLFCSCKKESFRVVADGPEYEIKIKTDREQSFNVKGVFSKRFRGETISVFVTPAKMGDLVTLDIFHKGKWCNGDRFSGPQSGVWLFCEGSK